MNLFKKKFPADEVGQKLSLLYHNGVNFKVKHSVIFTIQLVDKAQGTQLVEALKQKGFDGKLMEQNHEFYVVYSKFMFLEHEELVNLLKILNKLYSPLGGLLSNWEVKQ